MIEELHRQGLPLSGRTTDWISMLLRIRRTPSRRGKKVRTRDLRRTLRISSEFAEPCSWRDSRKVRYYLIAPLFKASHRYLLNISSMRFNLRNSHSHYSFYSEWIVYRIQHITCADNIHLYCLIITLTFSTFMHYRNEYKGMPWGD